MTTPAEDQPTPEVAEARRAWAVALMLRAEGTPPAYGTEAWVALPDGPEKVAAVVRAAEAWVLEGELFAERLAAEAKSAEDRAFQQANLRHRAAWDGRRGRFRPDPAIAAEIEAEWLEWIQEAG